MSNPDRLLKNLSFPAQYLDMGESLARALNWDVAEYYRYSGVCYPRQPLPGQTISGIQLLRSNEMILKMCPPGVPPLVTFMAHFPVTSHGPVGMMAITSRTLGEAMQAALDYSMLVMPAFAVRRHDVRDQVHMIFERLYDFGAVNDFSTETVVAAFLQIKPFLSRLPSHRLEVHFTHAAIGNAADYDKAFDATFIFNSQQNKIVLAREDLAIPLLAASHTSHMLMKATLEQQSQLQPDSRPVMQEVKRLMQKAMHENKLLDAGAIADAMAMSARTLSRRLKDEGYTLPQLRAVVGIEYAQVLLQETDKSITQIANIVGFKDAASFTRAYKRGTGTTPSSVRSVGSRSTK